MIKVYGIPNCNSVKKASDYLKIKGINFEFVNFKIEQLTENQVEKWIKEVTLGVLLNKKGTTYRALEPNEKSDLEAETTAIPLLIVKPTLFKRPIIEKNGVVIQVGFDEYKYDTLAW